MSVIGTPIDYTSSSNKNALQIVNAVQTELRMPLSANITDSHAKLILSFINRVLTDYIPEATVWDEHKLYDSVNTVASAALITISPPSNAAGIESIRSLQIGSNAAIVSLSDARFRDYKREHTTNSQPLVYRIYSRSNGSITLELCPTPDAIYALDYEGEIKPTKLVDVTDVALIDSDIIVVGAIMLAKKEQGVDYADSETDFSLKLGLESGNTGEGNWGDVETD